MFLDFSTVISYSIVDAVVILLGCKSLLPLKYQFSVVLVYLVLLSSFFFRPYVLFSIPGYSFFS